MNIVNIGTDKGLVGGKVLGDAIERHIKYGSFVDHLDIIVYTGKRDHLVQDFKTSENVTGHPTNSLSKILFFFDAIKIFEKIHQAHPVDIVVCQDPFIPGLIGWWLKKKYGIKLQINFHGDFWRNPNWLKEQWINYVFLLISLFTVPRADAIRVMSKGQKEKLIGAEIAAEKIRVISTPVDLSKFENSLVDKMKDGREKILLHIGRDDEVKDYDTLIGAFKIVKDKIPDVVLWQVGAEVKIKEAMARQVMAEDKSIELKGRLGHDTLVNIFYACDIFILSSTSESFGKVLVEAGACGRPVVSTSTTGAKEIIEDGRNGYLVPIGDTVALAEKIIYLLENPNEAQKMGERGQTMARENYGGNTEKIVNFWKDIINNAL